MQVYFSKHVAADGSVMTLAKIVDQGRVIDQAAFSSGVQLVTLSLAVKGEVSYWLHCDERMLATGVIAPEVRT